MRKPDWRRNFKEYDTITRRAMTAVEAMERDEPNPKVERLEDLLPPSSTAPAIVKGSRKRARKHTTAYRKAFGDS